jgi:hypothetical protein
MNRTAALYLLVLTAACTHHMPVVKPAEAHAGCYTLEWPDARPAVGFFPDTLGLAAEWFVPGDSTGGRLRVVRPRDASLATYRAYRGRFWWLDAADSLTVVKSDDIRGVRLSARIDAEGFVGVARSFGTDGRDEGFTVRGRHITCP